MALPSMAWVYLVHNRLTFRRARRYGAEVIANLPAFWCASLILVLVEPLAASKCPTAPAVAGSVFLAGAMFKFVLCAKWLWRLNGSYNNALAGV